MLNHFVLKSFRLKKVFEKHELFFSKFIDILIILIKIVLQRMHLSRIPLSTVVVAATRSQYMGILTYPKLWRQNPNLETDLPGLGAEPPKGRSPPPPQGSPP